MDHPKFILLFPTEFDDFDMLQFDDCEHLTKTINDPLFQKKFFSAAPEVSDSEPPN